MLSRWCCAGLQLRGATVAYNDKQSLSGYHVLRYWIHAQGLQPTATDEPFFGKAVCSVRCWLWLVALTAVGTQLDC